MERIRHHIRQMYLKKALHHRMHQYYRRPCPVAPFLLGMHSGEITTCQKPHYNQYPFRSVSDVLCTGADSTDGRRRRYHLGRPDPAAGIDLYLCTVHNSLHVLPTEAKGTSGSACKRRLPHYRE